MYASERVSARGEGAVSSADGAAARSWHAAESPSEAVGRTPAAKESRGAEVVPPERAIYEQLSRLTEELVSLGNFIATMREVNEPLDDEPAKFHQLEIQHAALFSAWRDSDPSASALHVSLVDYRAIIERIQAGWQRERAKLGLPDFTEDDARDYVQSEVEARTSVRPIKMTTLTRLVLRTLVQQNNQPAFTTEISDAADVPLTSVQSIMSRLAEAGWATSTKETLEQASKLGRGARRTWQLTDEGYREARVITERAQARRAARTQSAADDFDL